jgi:dynein light chain LC8-type
MPDDMARFCIETARKEILALEDWQRQGDAAVQNIRNALGAA